MVTSNLPQNPVKKWEEIEGKPNTYPPSAHTHDYAATNHNHDAAYAAKSHTHDYAATNHNHDAAYAAKSHTHNYAASNHSHAYTTITGRPTGLDSGYVRTGQKSGTTIGGYSTAEGLDTTASSNTCHAEGLDTTASYLCAHAEGMETTASGPNTHAEGRSTTASGSEAHAEGMETTASGFYSHAGGCNTIAAAHSQTAIGLYNVQYGSNKTNLDSIFIVGNGSSSARSNAFRVHSNGAVYGKSAYNTSGADYAEYFEWLDGNPEGKDRRGYFVTLDGDKIRIANPGDDYILGIISGKPSVIGNSDPDDWHGHFLCDDFGDFVMRKTKEKRTVYHTEEVEEAYIDENGDKAVRKVPQEVPEEIEVEVDSYVLNPDYNEGQAYIPRSDRQEWDAVGMLGVLTTRDDGTCQINGYCTVSDGGIATASDDGYRVIGRVAENLVKVVFR